MAVVVFAPPLLNYATLMREKQLLHPENHTLYDIGFGQKMFMTCMGHGKLIGQNIKVLWKMTLIHVFRITNCDY